MTETEPKAELDDLRRKLRAAELALHRLQALGKHWVTVAKAPAGKYSGPAVLAACDAFHAELEVGGSHANYTGTD